MSVTKIRTFFEGHYRSLDKGLLRGMFVLMLFGVFLTFAASPGVAERTGTESFHFIKKQLIFFPPMILVLFFMTFLPLKWIRIVCFGLLFASLIAMVYVLFFGVEIKGARRWINLGGLGVQPSEFVKPTFAVICAWFLASGRLIRRFHGYIASFVLWALISVLLYCQPDNGMLFTVTAIFCIELFVAGIPIKLVGILIAALAGLVCFVYRFQSHVQMRIDSFFNSLFGSGADTAYQVRKSMETLHNAGWLGKGPGEGIVKYELPDAHTDFIIAVAAEEFGFFLTMLLVGVFCFVILRGFVLIRRENNYFCQIAVAGLLTQIAFQAIVNMGSTLNLLPTKGMTLPFISYGGSSLVSVGLAFGIILGLTRYHTLSRGLE